MIIDKNLQIATALALPTGLGLGLVGDQIPLGSIGRDPANGRPLHLVISVTSAILSAGAATVEFQLVSDAQAAIAVDGTATVHSKTHAFPKATLVAGFQIAIPLPPQFPAYEAFIGLISNVGTAALTAGSINAFVTDNVQNSKAYPDAI